MSSSSRYTPFSPRPIRFLGTIERQGTRWKTYSIVHGGRELDRAVFEPGLALALREVPVPALELGRPGLGFAILHQGKTGDYVVISWWDRENELPTLVFVRDERGWRPAESGESFCVWDLEILWYERCSYVESVLAPSGASAEAYLAATVPASSQSAD